MITFVNVVTLVLCVLLIAYTANVSHIVADRTELQHVADAASASASEVQARMMNSLTAANHVIGEMLAMVVVHHAIGGELLDEGKAADTKELRNANKSLDMAYNLANGLGPGVTSLDAYDTVRERSNDSKILGEATLLDSKIELKKWLTFVYLNKAAGRAMQKYPPTYGAGAALEESMHPLELKILQECRTLKVLQTLASALVPVKKVLLDTALPKAKQYTDELVQHAASLMREAAQETVKQFDQRLSVELYSPTEAGLPVEIDPHAKANTQLDLPATAPIPAAGSCACGSERIDVTRDQVVKTSQLARAMFPWVVYHREPLLQKMKQLLPLAKSADFYKEYTEKYSKEFCNELQLKHNLGLYVIKGYPAPDKGFSLWTEQRDKADELFATVAVVLDETSIIVGAPAVFAGHQPNGRIAVAQSLLYNANPWVPHSHRIDLTCKRITPNRQPVFGQDTLNWDKPVWELIAKTDQGGPPAPEYPPIKVNWQVKLVPTSTFLFDSMRRDFETFREERLRKAIQQLPMDTPAALVAH